jgi:hypothetical protein
VFWDANSDSLSNLEKLLPIWELAIEQIQTTPDKWVTKEASADSKGRHFHEHRWRNQKRNKDARCNDRGELDTRFVLGEGWRW